MHGFFFWIINKTKLPPRGTEIPSGLPFNTLGQKNEQSTPGSFSHISSVAAPNKWRSLGLGSCRYRQGDQGYLVPKADPLIQTNPTQKITLAWDSSGLFGHVLMPSGLLMSGGTTFLKPGEIIARNKNVPAPKRPIRPGANSSAPNSMSHSN